MYWDDRQQEDRTDTVSGNRKRLLWRLTCRKLAHHSTSRHERAIYGILGADLSKVLPMCPTWEDACWACFKVMTDVKADQMILKYNTTHVISS